MLVFQILIYIAYDAIKHLLACPFHFFFFISKGDVLYVIGFVFAAFIKAFKKISFKGIINPLLAVMSKLTITKRFDMDSGNLFKDFVNKLITSFDLNS